MLKLDEFTNKTFLWINEMLFSPGIFFFTEEWPMAQVFTFTFYFNLILKSVLLCFIFMFSPNKK